MARFNLRSHRRQNVGIKMGIDDVMLGCTQAHNDATAPSPIVIRVSLRPDYLTVADAENTCANGYIVVNAKVDEPLPLFLIVASPEVRTVLEISSITEIDTQGF